MHCARALTMGNRAAYLSIVAVDGKSGQGDIKLCFISDHSYIRL